VDNKNVAKDGGGEATGAPKRRVPQRGRGEKRMAELLEAAAAEIAAVGYEAATMKAIAERSGTSVGTVYQYFPNKEAVVVALRTQYGNEMEERWLPLMHEEAGLGTAQLVERMFEVLMEYLRIRPAFVPLTQAPSVYSRDPAARIRLREHFAALFRARRPSLTPAQATRIANVTLQIIRGMHQMHADAKPRERGELAAEFKRAVSAYLIARLDGADEMRQ
jgi:AcrR family transcriptional regulator